MAKQTGATKAQLTKVLKTANTAHAKLKDMEAKQPEAGGGKLPAGLNNVVVQLTGLEPRVSEKGYAYVSWRAVVVEDSMGSGETEYAGTQIRSAPFDYPLQADKVTEKNKQWAKTQKEHLQKLYNDTILLGGDPGAYATSTDYVNELPKLAKRKPLYLINTGKLDDNGYPRIYFNGIPEEGYSVNGAVAKDDDTEPSDEIPWFAEGDQVIVTDDEGEYECTVEAIDLENQEVDVEADGEVWTVPFTAVSEPETEDEGEEEEEDEEEDDTEESDEYIPEVGDETVYNSKDIEVLTVNKKTKTVTAKYVDSGRKVKGTIPWDELEG